MLPKVYTVSFSTGASHSETVQFNEVFERMNMGLGETSGTFGANDPLWLEASSDGTNFYRMVANEAQTAVVASNDLQISSGVSLRMIPLPFIGCDYMRLRLTTGTTASSSLQFTFTGHKTR